MATKTRLTPAEREAMRKADLAAMVAAIVARAPAATEAQLDTLRRITKVNAMEAANL